MAWMMVVPQETGEDDVRCQRTWEPLTLCHRPLPVRMGMLFLEGLPKT